MGDSQYDNPISRTFRTDDEKELLESFIQYLEEQDLSAVHLKLFIKPFIQSRLPK
jgi:hypothetical protein